MSRVEWGWKNNPTNILTVDKVSTKLAASIRVAAAKEVGVKASSNRAPAKGVRTIRHKHLASIACAIGAVNDASAGLDGLIGASCQPVAGGRVTKSQLTAASSYRSSSATSNDNVTTSGC